MTARDVRRASQRFSTEMDWLDSHHSFSFGHHYDAENTHFGLLLVSNDDVVKAGTGFETHPHRDMEIITWVLDGELVHQDSEGNNGVIYPGLAQRMSAGRGILHSEKNDSWRLRGQPAHEEDVHFIQMWIPPDERGLDPGYEQLDVSAELAAGDLVAIASGMAKHDAAIRIRQRDAALHVARMSSGGSVRLPAAPFTHVFVARGSIDVEGGGHLAAGDSVRLTNADDLAVSAATDAEILVWEMHAELT